MDFLLPLLAALGVVAILARLLRAGFAAVLAVAERTAASGLADASRRRGDLTGFAERQQAAHASRRAARLNLALVLLWLGLLVVPPTFGVALPVYAAAAALWLLPKRGVRARPSGKKVERAD